MMTREEKIEQLIQELDDARENGTVFTYGLVQDRLREVLEKEEYTPSKEVRVTVIIDDGDEHTVIEIPRMQELAVDVEYHEPERVVRGSFMDTRQPEEGIKRWSLSGIPQKMEDGVFSYTFTRAKSSAKKPLYRWKGSKH